MSRYATQRAARQYEKFISYRGLGDLAFAIGLF
jgi:hypothetical protein